MGVYSIGTIMPFSLRLYSMGAITHACLSVGFKFLCIVHRIAYAIFGSNYFANQTHRIKIKTHDNDREHQHHHLSDVKLLH